CARTGYGSPFDYW
nr:immunoglobulin heavy chain junction region [Mus musculus]NSM07484.1 immunoglobulin heavy chain junction region [Mus musculus]NSM09313.1 immunoglobulin heavy chain junction region [Mus musculus]